MPKTSDPHTGYVLESLFDAAGDLITASAADTPAKLAKGSTGDFLQAGASALSYVSVFIPVNFSKERVVSTTTGTFRWYNRSGRTLTFHSASAAAAVGPNGSTMTIDVNVNDTTIMTGTKVVLPDTSGAASNVEQTTFSTTTITDDQYITVDIDTAGGGAVEDLVVSVWLKG